MRRPFPPSTASQLISKLDSLFKECKKRWLIGHRSVRVKEIFIICVLNRPITVVVIGILHDALRSTQCMSLYFYFTGGLHMSN